MPRRSPLLLLLFFGSGVSALVYEVVWIRLLTLTLSITVYSLATVLSAFMAGLALGAAISAAVADRIRRPLVAFGLAELGIAASGVAVPAILFNLGPVYIWFHDALGGQGLAFGSSRFLLAFSVMLVPSTLMGLTLPLLTRAVIAREDAVGRDSGALYGANTLGAVVGCIAAGFAMIPALGLRATSASAALLNVTIALVAMALGWNARLEVTPRPAWGERRGPVPASLIVGAVAFGVSGFAAMGYEVLWTRALEHFTHNSTYAYSAMLATFLLGLGAGSAVMARFADRIRRTTLAIAVVQLGIGATVAAALVIYMQFEWLVPSVSAGIGGLTSWPRVVALLFAETGLTMLVTTVLLGAMFPLVVRLAVDSLGAVGRRVGIVYTANTVGSILGSLLVGFVILPAFGVRGAFMALIATNLFMGGCLGLVGASPRTALGLTALALSLAVLAFVGIPPRLFEDQFVARFGVLKFYREEVTDTVMVTEAEDGERMIRYADGRGTAGTFTVVGDRMYAHIPLLLHPAPRKLLQIAFGVGNSLASALTYPLESVDCVELSPGVIEAAPYFRATNRDSLEDPRVHLVINDGRNFLLTSHDRYDVIRLDPPELHTAGVVNLYTREFYQLARDHLAEGGIFSVWINIVMTPEDDIRMLLRTVATVFPHVSVWHDPKMFSWIINGSLDPHHPDLRVLQRHFSQPGVREDLQSIGLRTPFDFLSHFVFSGEALSAFAGAGPLVVDDHTRLDFSVPRSKDSFFGIANYNTNRWLVQLMEPETKRDVAFATFVRKVVRMAGYKRPVLSELTGVEAAGFDRGDVQRRLAAALSALPAP